MFRFTVVTLRFTACFVSFRFVSSFFDVGICRHGKVDYMDLDGKTYLSVPGHTKQIKYEFGTLTHFAYRVDGDEGEELVVATTRLETMLGDTVSTVNEAVGSE